MKTGKLIILAGPSGSGKTTIARHLLDTIETLRFSISSTTRIMRDAEENGKDYHFLTNDEFREKIAKDEFIEHEEVYHGTFYGTMKTELERIWKEGHVPILDIDVYGALNVKKQYGDKVLTVFIHPVNIANIKSRLTQRATESEESYRNRIRKAEEELSKAEYFDEIIYNDDLQHAMKKAENVVNKFLN